MITLSPTIAHTAQNQIVKIKNWLPCPCPCRLIIAVKKSSQGAIFSKKNRLRRNFGKSEIHDLVSGWRGRANKEQPNDARIAQVML